MSKLVQLIGSKRLTAALVAFGGAIAVVLLGPHFGLTDNQVMTATAGIVSPMVAFIFSQWHLDVSTQGKTTTAFYLLNALGKAVVAATEAEKEVTPAPPPVPPSAPSQT